MTKTKATGQTCVGAFRLSALDIGFDPRVCGFKIHVPDNFPSVGLDDRDGNTYLITGTREEMLHEIRKAGYRIAGERGRV